MKQLRLKRLGVPAHRPLPPEPEPPHRFLEMRRQSGLSCEQLAAEAGLPLRVAFLAEIGGAVSHDEASRLVDAFNRLTGKTFTLDQLPIALKHKEQLL